MTTIDNIVQRIVESAVREELARLGINKPATQVPQAAHGVQRLFTVLEASKLVGASTDYIYARIKDGSLIPVEIGSNSRSKYRIRADHLQNFIDDRTYGRS